MGRSGGRILVLALLLPLRSMIWHWHWASGSGHGRGTHLQLHPHPHFASRLKPISHLPSPPISLRRPFPLSLSLSFHPPPCDLPVCFLHLASLTLTPIFVSASHLPSEPYVSHTLYHFTDCRLLPCLNILFLVAHYFYRPFNLLFLSDVFSLCPGLRITFIGRSPTAWIRLSTSSASFIPHHLSSPLPVDRSLYPSLLLTTRRCAHLYTILILVINLRYTE